MKQLQVLLLILLAALNSHGLVTMSTPTEEFSLGSAATANGFGSTIVRGNFNNDAYEDMVVLSPHTVSGTGKAGAFSVFHGKSTGFSTTPTITIVGPDALNDASKPAFNTAVVGDFNGDNYDDLAIGVPYWNKSGSYYQGRVVIYWGRNSGLLAAGHLLIETPVANGNFGSKIKAGDLNGDGKDDLVVTAPKTNSPGSGKGHVFAFFGSSTMNATVDRTWTDATSTTGQVFGGSLVVANITGDNKADVVISNVNTISIEAHYFKGAATVPTSPTQIKAITTDKVLADFAADFNQDGYDDLIFHEMPKSQFAIYPGSSSFSFASRIDREFSANHTYICSITDIRDVNSDSYPDIICNYVYVNKTDYKIRIFPGNPTNYVTTTPIFHFNDNDATQGTSITRGIAINDDNSPLPKLFAHTKKDPDIYYVYEHNLNNNPPVVSSAIPNITKDEDDPQFLHSDLDNVFTDPEGHALTFAIQSNSNSSLASVSINSDHRISITPGANKYGTATIVVRATESPFGTVVRDTFTLTINSVNDAPTMKNPLPNRTKNEDFSSFSSGYSLYFQDVDNNSLSISLVYESNPGIIQTTFPSSSIGFKGIANQHGVDTMIIRATDAGGLFVQDTMVFTVNPVNDAPTLTSITNQTTNEDEYIQLTLAMTNAADVDGTTPTLLVGSGSNYTVSGTTITPTNNFNGELIVPIQATDGFDTTTAVSMTITITPVNDAPTLTSVTNQTIDEDGSLEVTLAMTNASDIDGTTPTLLIGSGANYTVTGTTVIPTTNFNGELTIPVQATDGIDTTAALSMTITVTPVNDKPTISFVNSQTILENDSLLLTLAMTDASDIDGDPLTLIIGSGSNYSVSENHIKPNPLFNGALSVPVSVTDGTDTTASVNLSITVTNVNNSPVITSATSQTINEDSSITITLSMTDATDPDGTIPTLIISSGSNYTTDGLNVIPTANYNGNLNIPISVTDGLDTSAIIFMQVTILPINDKPSLTQVDNSFIYMNETIEISIDLTDASDIEDENLTIIIKDGENYTINNLEIIPNPNFIGELSVPVCVTDGQDTSNIVSWIINVDQSTLIESTDLENNNNSDELLFAPNPANISTDKVYLQIPNTISGSLKIQIFDATGNLLDESTFHSNEKTFSWDLTNMYGQKVSSGIYRVYIIYQNERGEIHKFKRMIGVYK